jgi:hypothetical protein
MRPVGLEPLAVQPAASRHTETLSWLPPKIKSNHEQLSHWIWFSVPLQSATALLGDWCMTFQSSIEQWSHLGAESFVFQSAIQKLEDQDIQNYNLARCFVWV